jgi:hypothetical protein
MPESGDACRHVQALDAAVEAARDATATASALGWHIKTACLQCCKHDPHGHTSLVADAVT